MEKRIGVFTPAQRNDVLAVVKDYLTRTGLLSRNVGQQSYNQPLPVYVSNVSGVAVPSFACMQVTGTVEYGGQNYVTVTRPADTTGAAGLYLFNGFEEIEIGGYGVAQDGPLVRVLTSGAAITCGANWQPTVAQWYASPGAGLLSAIGADDIATDIMKAFVFFQKPDIDLRISGLNFQINYNLGGGWETWATGEECPP